MKQTILIVLSIACWATLNAQQSPKIVLNLSECQQMARSNYPLIKQYELIDKSRDFNIANAGKGYLPQLSLGAKGSYQSEVTQMPVAIPGYSPLNKDQYSVALDLSQTIWDGGVAGSQKELARTAAQVSARQMDVDLYAINDRVNQLYFSILLLNARLAQSELHQKELQRNYDLVAGYMAGGVANQSDLDIIRVEQFKALQTDASLVADRRMFVTVLGTLIGAQIADNAQLEEPSISEPEVRNGGGNRPEFELFEARHQNLEAQQSRITAGIMPRISLFATAGYGRPGLNMLKNRFDTYYVGGVRASWNFGGLYTTKNDRRIVQLNQKSVELQRETFEFNNSIEISQRLSMVKKQNDLLAQDDQIIALRGRIADATKTKLSQGTATASDLVRDLTAKDAAIQAKIAHQIEHALALYNLKYATNE